MEKRRAIRTLRTMPPNTATNSKTPWKDKTSVTRMWCPLHERQGWFRLLVAVDGADVRFECEARCSQSDIEAAIQARASAQPPRTAARGYSADVSSS